MRIGHTKTTDIDVNLATGVILCPEGVNVPRRRHDEQVQEDCGMAYPPSSGCSVSLGSNVRRQLINICLN